MLMLLTDMKPRLTEYRISQSLFSADCCVLNNLDTNWPRVRCEKSLGCSVIIKYYSREFSKLVLDSLDSWKRGSGGGWCGDDLSWSSQLHGYGKKALLAITSFFLVRAHCKVKFWTYKFTRIAWKAVSSIARKAEIRLAWKTVTRFTWKVVPELHGKLSRELHGKLSVRLHGKLPLSYMESCQ